MGAKLQLWLNYLSPGHGRGCCDVTEVIRRLKGRCCSREADMVRQFDIWTGGIKWERFTWNDPIERSAWGCNSHHVSQSSLSNRINQLWWSPWRWWQIKKLHGSQRKRSSPDIFTSWISLTHPWCRIKVAVSSWSCMQWLDRYTQVRMFLFRFLFHCSHASVFLHTGTLLN